MFEEPWRRILRKSPQWFHQKAPQWEGHLLSSLLRYQHPRSDLNSNARTLFYGNLAFYVSRVSGGWEDQHLDYIYKEVGRSDAKSSINLKSSIMLARRGVIHDVLLEAAYTGLVPESEPGIKSDPRHLNQAVEIPAGGDVSVALAGFIFFIVGPDLFHVTSLNQVEGEGSSLVTRVTICSYATQPTEDVDLYFNLQGRVIDRARFDAALAASIG